MRLSLALIAFSAALAAPAFAAAPAPSPAAPAPAAAAKDAAAKDDAMAAAMCKERLAFQAAQMDRLGTELKLKPAQKPAFDAWKNERLGILHNIPCPPPQTGFGVPAPDRVKNEITMVSFTLDGLRKELPTTEALYKALDPDQRAVFDGPIKTASGPSAPAPSAAKPAQKP